MKHLFTKGYTPWNKGLKGIITWGFKKGHTPWNKGVHKAINDNFKKWNENHKDEKHWNWIKDRSLVKRQDKRDNPRYKQWIKEIKKRDKVCQLKNKECDGYLVVHHIKPWRDYPELRYELSNGITLCQVHHPRKRIDELKLIPIFTELVMQMN